MIKKAVVSAFKTSSSKVMLECEVSMMQWPLLDLSVV